MEKEINFQIDDISEELLILNKYTIEKLFKLDNCVNCIALYIFYYKTAKWQKTNTIKATDLYVKKCLKWGNDKIKQTKKTLKENGLIEIVQRRDKGKIVGWYIKLHYIVPKEKIENSKIIVESNNSQNQQVVESTSGGEDTNALREQLNALKIENKMLKDKIKERKKEESEEKKPKKTSYDLIIDKFTDDPELKDAIYEFIKMRKLIKKPLTDRALTMILNKLKKLSTDRKIQTEILNQSIMNNWQSIYKLKTDNDWKSKKTGYKPQKFEQEEVTVDEISELRKQLDKEMREKYGEQYLEYKERFNL